MEANDNKEKEYLKELGPNLMRHKESENTPEVPEGYFEGFSDKMLERIGKSEIEPNKKGKLISLINFRNIGIAAALAFTIGLLPFLKSYFSNSNSGNAEVVLLSDEVLMEASEAYIIDEEFSDELLYESLERTENTEELLSLSDEVSHEDLTEYLIETEIDEYLIIEAL